VLFYARALFLQTDPTQDNILEFGMLQQQNDTPVDDQIPTSSSFRLYLLTENPSKRNNLGPFLRCAAAFGVETFVFVGYAHCSTHGSHGADKHVKTVAFPSFSQAIEFLRKPMEAGGCNVNSVIGCLGPNCGAGAFHNSCTVVEKDTNLIPCDALNRNIQTEAYPSEYPPSYPVHLRPFRNGNVCFLLSKYRSGLPKDQASFCDLFVHVPISPTFLNADDESQLGLMDAQTSLSIILHHWTAWANFNVRKFSGQKFQVATISQGSQSDAVGLEKRTERKMTKLSQIEASEETLSADNWTSLFGD
jgi:hypothetical protein